MSDLAEESPALAAESVDGRKVRSRIRVVIIHVLRSSVFPPLLVKYLLFAFLALAEIRPRFAIPIWVLGAIAIYVFALRRSLAAIRRKAIVERPERCIIPCMICFFGFAFFSLLIDVTLSTNSGVPRPGRLILLSTLVNCGILVWQSLATQRAFVAMPGSGEPPFTARQALTFVGDLAALIAFLILLLVAIEAI